MRAQLFFQSCFGVWDHIKQRAAAEVNGLDRSLFSRTPARRRAAENCREIRDQRADCLKSPSPVQHLMQIKAVGALPGDIWRP